MPIMNTSAQTLKVSPTAAGRDLAGSSPETSLPLRNVSREQWWESVLPPGQLAERLRTAQAGPSTVSLDEGPRSSRRGIVRNSSDRSNPGSSKHYTSSSSSLRTSPMESPNAYLSPPSTAGSRTRAGTWSSVNSSHPSSSTRSSISFGDWSSASSSNDEGSTGAERVSPVLPEDWSSGYGFPSSSGERSSGTTSPTYCISRSQSNRRRRVLASDDGVGLGVNIRGHKSNVIDLDERFHQWNSGLPFHPAAPQSTSSVHLKHSQAVPAHTSPSAQSALGLRPFPSSLSTSSSRHSFGGSSVFIETPDHSSDEDRAAEAQRLARRSGRTSSTLTTDTVRDVHSTIPRSDSSSLKSAPASRRSSMIGSNHHLNNALSSSARRVSFNQDVEVVQGNDVKSRQTIGHSHGRTLSTASDKAYRQRFHTHSSSRASNHAAEVRAHAQSHVRGQRTPCHSAPTSPKLATMANLHKEHVPSRLSQDTRRATTDRVQDVRGEEDDEDARSTQLAILSSLSLATSQFSTARNLARALTRQLSAPIRPVLHLTLFASISSMAFVALAGFLIAGYLCTVWDDVNSRGKSLQKNVSSARQKIETRVQWTRSLLGAGDATVTAEKESAKKVPTSVQSSKASSASSTGHRRTPSGVQANATKLFTAPIKLAFSLPAAIIVFLTPEGIKSAYSSPSTTSTPSSTKTKSSAARSSTRSAHHRHQSSSVPPPRSSSGLGGSPSMDAGGLGGSSSGFHNLPPRPPLSSLLPSIAFTIVIACGAGLASFFASRAAASSSSSPMDDATSTTPMSSARATPNSSAPSSPHVRHHSRGASMTGRFDSHASSVHSSGPASSLPSSRRRSAQSISSLHSAGLDHAHYGGHSRPLSFDSRRSSLARHDVSTL